MSRSTGASLGGGLEPSGDSCGFRGLLVRMRLTAREVPPGDDCGGGVFWGATRLVIRGPCQAVWRRAVPLRLIS